MSSSTFLYNNEDPVLINAKKMCKALAIKAQNLIEKKPEVKPEIDNPFVNPFAPLEPPKPLTNLELFEANKKRNPVSINQEETKLDDKPFCLAVNLLNDAFRIYSYELRDQKSYLCLDVLHGFHDFGLNIRYQGHCPKEFQSAPTPIAKPISHIDFAEFEKQCDIFCLPLTSTEWQASSIPSHVTHIFKTQTEALYFSSSLTQILSSCGLSHNDRLPSDLTFSDNAPFNISIKKEILEQTKLLFLGGEKKLSPVVNVAEKPKAASSPTASGRSFLNKTAPVPLAPERKSFPPGGAPF